MNSFEITIDRLANNGCGIGTAPDGKKTFVTAAVPGDRLEVIPGAEKPRFREASILRVIEPSPARIPADCPYAEECGGCCFRRMRYEAEAEAKAGFVRDAFRRIGGFDLELSPIVPSPLTDAYRNKVEFAVQGKTAGFYSERTHRVIPIAECRAVPPEFIRIKDRLCTLAEMKNIVLRKSGLTGEIMAVVVTADEHLPREKEFAAAVREALPEVTTLIHNIKAKSGGQVLGTRCRTLYGAGFIRDRIRGVPVEPGPLSFLQVNTPAAELLYGIAAGYADLKPGETLLDLYCGMGTIGLSMASAETNLIGVEIVPEAVKSAERSAAALGIRSARFICGDAGRAADDLIREHLRPDVIVLDPPRRGCSAETIAALRALAPSRIVMVSCDPATAARDAKSLGYLPVRATPVDLFPRTKHVETVCLLVRRNSLHIDIDVDVEEMLQEKRGQATYAQIKDYVLEQNGLKVSSLYISQVKRKCGLDVGQNYNLSKKEDAKQPQCPPEKERAITEALQHFGMI